MKTGIMGGTFNPPHTGHINAAEAAKKKLALDRVIFIPTGTPPHKEMEKKSASSVQRFEMASIAAKLCGCEISDIELKRKGKSFTFDTVAELKRLYPEDELFLIVGTDMFLSIETWHRAKELLRCVSIAVVPRSEADIKALLDYAEVLRKAYGTSISIIEASAVTISSTELRREISSGQAERYLPKEIKSYIEDNGLYDAVEE